MTRVFFAMVACAAMLTMGAQITTKVPVPSGKILVAECDGPLPQPCSPPCPGNDNA